VLEVGAGIGETTLHLCDGRQSAWTCLEPDATLATKLDARLRTASLTPRPAVVVGSIEQLPAASEFDCVLYIDVLEHIEDDRGELHRAAELLAHGGAVVVLSPAYPWLFTEFDRSLGHFRRYTRASLARAFPPELERRRLFYLDSVGCLASAANKLLLRQSLPSRAQIAFWDRALVSTSRLLDPVLAHRIGRSVIGIYTKR
jgi:SAM-dependent methyltransferase